MFLTDDMSELYTEFLLKQTATLFYVSNKYRLFLRELLKANDCYLLALNKHAQIVGALPAMIIKNARHGAILNSLPFYGSNGFLILSDDYPQAGPLLMYSLDEIARQLQCSAMTFITSPFGSHTDSYLCNSTHMFRDERIGQISALPPFSSTTSSDLMNTFEESVRRNIRKAAKNRIEIRTDFSPALIDFLYEEHCKNMEAIGGNAKPKAFFSLLNKYFTFGEDFKIYTAFLHGRPIAALLVFLFNRTVEYITPVIVREFRSLQALSLTIFEAMRDAIAQGYLFWNWGGTWKSQNSLYRFKKRWGAQDMPYYYFTQILNAEILRLKPKEMLIEYPGFYVAPFDQLPSPVDSNSHSAF